MQARKVHAFLKPKGAILKITSVTPEPTAVTKTSHEETVAVKKEQVPIDQGVSKGETPFKGGSPARGERRVKPRVHPGIQIHPMAVGELLDRSFRLLRRHFWLFFIIMLIPQGLFFLMRHGVSLVFGIPGEGARGIGAGFGVFTVFAFLAFVMVQFWAQGALIYAVSETYLGHSSSIKGSYNAIRKRLGQLLSTMILWGVLVFIWPALAGILSAVLLPVLAALGIRGAVLIITSVIAFIVTVWLALNLLLNWVLVDKIVVLENMGWMSALRRSKELMNAGTEPGFWRRPRTKAAQILLLGFLIAIGIHFLFHAPGFLFNLFAPGSLMGSTLTGLLNTISTSLAATYTTIAMILYYYDIRVRKEGFDLKMMAQNL
jgi:MFS family permease